MNEKTTEGLTSADIKKQIMEATRESKAKTQAKESGIPLTGMVASEINATDPIPEIEPKTESKSEPIKATEKDTAQSVDYKEWAKKKGIDWTTEESILKALHMSDVKFHERQAERKAKEAIEKGQSNWPPGYQAPIPPQYPPNQPVFNGYQQPTYVPSNQRQIIEDLARQNNMTPEDFERVAKVSREVYEASAIADRQRWQSELEEIKRKEEKNSVFRELSSDPVFRRPDVAVEFHNILDQMQSADPQSFEKDPTQYKQAFDKAVNNLGRRYLEGRPLQEGVPLQANGVQVPPMTPPKPYGQGSGGGYNENENAINPEEFAKMSLKDKKALFERMGLRTQYQ